ncbi:MAG: 16S rRNA (uracil(1498)-N(3))-methyltransferase [Vicinamibacterales bacterium]|nr:16S rRNA (uracil(1498)-N(3))-methyltransferase [Vicinamibacterales bacterium]
MPPRFHVPGLVPDDPLIDLPGEEAHHLHKVLRLGAGAAVRVFDGRGGEWDAEVVESGSRAVRVRRGAMVAAAPEAGVAITLAVALLKGDKLDEVVRDAVMLGVHAIRPFTSAHTEARGAARARSGRGRWARIALASTKQCGRAVLPVVHEVAPLASILAAPEGQGILLAEPAHAARRLADLGAAPPPSAATLMVGPEGGWHPGEVADAMRQGWTILTLGPRTLRADAAPIVALTAVMAVWGEL